MARKSPKNPGESDLARARDGGPAAPDAPPQPYAAPHPDAAPHNGESNHGEPNPSRADQTGAVASPTASELPLAHPITIVGVGASAGGMEAFIEVLRRLPTDTGMAFVLVQHLSAQHESVLPHLLSTATSMPVLQAEGGVEIRPNHVYVIPPNTQLTVHCGRLRLEPRPDDRTQYTPIDVFFRSLADDMKSRAIGVVLSGTASDGSAGLQEINAVGGIAIAQDPTTAKHDGMPRAAIATGVVDLVLPPAQIAAELARLANHPLLFAEPAPDPAEGTADGTADDARSAAAPARDDDANAAADDLAQIFILLRRAFGVDFTLYKQATIRRRLQRRMVLHRIGNVEDYVAMLREKPAEVAALYGDILIHVTRFFREPESFETLTTVVFPQLRKQRQADTPLRFWVAGCATGEEAYSIAIAILEFLGDQADAVPVQVFATDVSDAAIEQARAGVYPASIAADVSPERLRRYFNKVDSGYRIAKHVRDLCVFARQDLTRDPPFSRLDLIVCRNVLIYLTPVLQRRLMSVFNYALRPAGFLMLGAAETVGAQSDLFAIADKRYRVYRKRHAEARPLMQFSLPDGAASSRAEPPREQHPRTPAPTSTQREADRVLRDRYAPPGVLVDAGMQILQTHGQTGRFLELPAGSASLSLLKMAREGLLPALRTALHEARTSDVPVRRDNVLIHDGEHTLAVAIEVVPVRAGEGARHFLVLFQEGGRSETPTTPPPPQAAPPGKPAGSKKRSAADAADADTGSVRRLQEELAASRDYLEAIIQDHEAANEELQSANEEILSANEELQSTNEELDTAKEELQSTNEELNTVNEELHGRNDELSRANSDLINFLGSVQVALVMVSSDLRIRRFTPMAEKVLNLIPTDIGRPIAHIKPNIDCPDLEALIHGVVETVTPQERDVRDGQGRWYALRIRPYKDVDNRIDGAVLVLFDIDAARRHELDVQAALRFAEAIVETARAPLVVLDASLRVQSANPAFGQWLRIDPSECRGKLLYELGSSQLNIPRLRALLEEVLPKDRRIEDFRMDHDFKGFGRRTLAVNARRMDAGPGHQEFILLSMEDITGREEHAGYEKPVAP